MPKFVLDKNSKDVDFNFENELKDKIALVTGGSKGAGKAIADRLLKAGATVIITARNKPEENGNGGHSPHDLTCIDHFTSFSFFQYQNLFLTT
ncbi:hypothetical protein GCM10010967_56970 [Dyadobacter beijingensis]|uniref:Short chain dehydrogenase n=1 Tax=Dyadobacter beijingensis TaxID=365489 RepID=A0ABQ2IJ35_9BACT|nr:hypothetical protein GCM10010967_56970 [Dyadobacter beijingensis]